MSDEHVLGEDVVRLTLCLRHHLKEFLSMVRHYLLDIETEIQLRSHPLFHVSRQASRERRMLFHCNVLVNFHPGIVGVLIPSESDVHNMWKQK